MTQGHLEAVVALQSDLDRLEQARQRLHGIPDWMRELHQEHAARLEEINALEAAIEQARLERRNAEGTIAEAQEKLKRYQKQINDVQTQREYGALLQEIDTVKGEIRALEESAFASMERRDEAEKSLEQNRQDFAELDGRYKAELAKWEAEKPTVAAEVGELERRVAALRTALPKPYLSQFQRLYERLSGQAVAAIHISDRGGRAPQSWHCSVCNWRVRPQVVVEIRNTGGLIQCDSCKRILYVEAPEHHEVEV